MLLGRWGFWPFLLAWAAIAAGITLVICTVLWLGGSFPI